jgi:hypothetical protein
LHGNVILNVPTAGSTDVFGVIDFSITRTLTFNMAQEDEIFIIGMAESTEELYSDNNIT